MKTIIKKIAVVILSTSACSVSMTASAGLFDNLADVADGALAAYGHTDGHRDRRDLTSAEIDNALREALALSAGYAGQQMARSGHYANGKGLMIPLPLKWREARKVAQRIGYSGDFDSLHQQVNTAAIESVPALIKLIDNEVDALAFTNPVELLHSSEKTAASEYLRKYSDASLRTYLRPVVKRALVRSGASATGLKIATRVGSLPMVRNLPLDLTDHVVDATIENFFRQLGLQETAIRTDPRRRTSGLLKKVFG